MEKLEKYIELKETIETFLKKRNDLKKRKDLYEPIKISLLDYLYILNIVIYGEREIFPEELRKEIKDEIRKWSKWGYHPKDHGFSSYYFYLIESEENDKEKVEEVRQINIMFSELLQKIWSISTEIFEYDIYPF